MVPRKLKQIIRSKAGVSQIFLRWTNSHGCWILDSGYVVICLGDESLFFDFLSSTGHKLGLRDCILQRVFQSG
jgi:hypothetical protein